MVRGREYYFRDVVFLVRRCGERLVGKGCVEKVFQGLEVAICHFLTI